MKITFSPMRDDRVLRLERAGDRLTINGEAFDFSPLPEGATLPTEAVACDWIAGAVTRVNGVLAIPLILPLGPDAPSAARFPMPVVPGGDGPIPLPTEETPA